MSSMSKYDMIIGKMITSTLAMEEYVVSEGEPLYVRDGVREITGFKRYD